MARREHCYSNVLLDRVSLGNEAWQFALFKNARVRISWGGSASSAG